MLTSLIKNLPNPTIEDTGLPQQVELVEYVTARTGRTPPILDARDVLEHPRETLAALCERVGVEISENMLHWPAGRRETDGIWAKHWYAAVERSTGFEPYRPKDETVPDKVRPLLTQCIGHYERLHAMRIRT
jgi:hypothetical protein